MIKYILRRLLYIVFVFFVVSILQFIIFKMVPGDPVKMMMEGNRDAMKPGQYEKKYEAMRLKLGLDKPVPVQYFYWIGNLVTGDLGYSTKHQQPVIDVIGDPLSNTVKLNIITLVFVFAITIPLGIATAVRKGSLFDSIVQVSIVIGYSLPPFIFAILFIFFFAVNITIFPVSGAATPGFEGSWWAKELDQLRYLALPVMTLVFSSLGGITRYVRASMIDALSMDYIRTARAKGLRERVVVYSHAFRNSLIPFVTILIGWFVSVFSGSLVIERIFSLNGMGKMLVDSIQQQDYAVALALEMFYVVLALLANLIMDIGYSLVDPRVKLS